MRRALRIFPALGVSGALAIGLVAIIGSTEPAGAVGPVVSAINPNSGAQGATVTLSGSGFSGAALSASVGSEHVPVTVTSNTTASLSIPADASAGSATITIANNGVSLARTFGFTVFQFTSQITDAEVGVNYNPRILVTGGRAPYSWSVASGVPPPGLTFSAAGVFAGTPKIPGPATLTVQATDANGASGQFTVTVNVDPGPTIANVALDPATIGSPYSELLAVTGGTPPYQWSINSGPIPGGLVLSSTGVLSGRPGALGSSTVALRVTDALGSVSSKSFSLTVRPVPQAMTLLTASGFSETTSTFITPLAVPTPLVDAVGVATSADGTKTWFADSSGTVTPALGTVSLGQLGRAPKRPVVAIASRPDGAGYWLVTAAGHVYAFGSAHDYGSVKGRITGRVISIVPTPTGRGYFIVTSKGHLYRFGNAPRLTSPRPGRLHGTAVGAAFTPDGRGVFVASTSGVVLRFGTARKESVAPPAVTGPVIAIVGSPSGEGYWLVTATGVIAPTGTAEALPYLSVPPGFVTAAAGAV